jgi:hypothetical protein
MPITAKESKLANSIAQSLRQELLLGENTEIQVRVQENRSQFTFADDNNPKPHSQSRPGFTTEGGQPKAKNLAYEYLGDDANIHLFCIGCVEFERSAGMDVDHATSHHDIVERIEGLLDYLNDKTREFKEYFLAFPEMSNFFHLDDTGKIQATRYFYKVCCNAYTNLVLICHGCNISKGKKNLIEYYTEAYGNEFNQAVSEAGVEVQGLIFDRIMPRDLVGIEELQIAGRTVSLDATGQGMGLGEFCRVWFENSGVRKDYYKLLNQLQNRRNAIVTCLDAYADEIESGNLTTEEAMSMRARFSKDIKRIDTILGFNNVEQLTQVASAIAAEISSSSSDDEKLRNSDFVKWCRGDLNKEVVEIAAKVHYCMSIARAIRKILGKPGSLVTNTPNTIEGKSDSENEDITIDEMVARALLDNNIREIASQKQIRDEFKAYLAEEKPTELNAVIDRLRNIASSYREPDTAAYKKQLQQKDIKIIQTEDELHQEQQLRQQAEAELLAQKEKNLLLEEELASLRAGKTHSSTDIHDDKRQRISSSRSESSAAAHLSFLKNDLGDALNQDDEPSDDNASKPSPG